MTAQLTAIEVRILGALIEKEATTPDNYPLSLNALVNACNQTSNRDPVMELGEDAIRWAVNNLRQQSLVRAIQPSDSRVMKYQHLVTEKLGLDTPSLAVLCVLMLRGPQTIGEIRGRTNRLAEFTGLDEIDAVLRGLQTRELVDELPRRPGQKETRFAHLLSGPVEQATGVVDARMHAPVTSQTSAQTGAVSLASHDAGGRSANDADANDRTAEDRIAVLEATIDALRHELNDLRSRFEEFRAQFS